MKFTKPAFVLLAVLVLAYAACKKSPAKPNTQTASITNNPQLAQQLAISFYQAITGKNGGADLSKGIHAPANLSANHTGHVVYSTNPLCGYSVDTAFTQIVKVGDTVTNSFRGSFNLTYNCSGDTLNGYTNKSIYSTAVKSTNTSDSVYVNQNFLVTALNKACTLVSMGGAINTYEIKRVLNGPYYTNPFAQPSLINTDYYVWTFQYTLNGVTVDVSNGTPDVKTGVANISIVTFTANSKYIDSIPLGGGGTITFIGNYLAKVNITSNAENAVYTVNMLTGQIVK